MKLNKISADMVSRRPDQTAEWLNRLKYSVEEVEATLSKGGGNKDLVPATTTRLGGIIVGDNLTITSWGRLSAVVTPGATTYAQLPDKPSINNVTLVGNKSLSDLGINIPSSYWGQTMVNGTVGGTLTLLDGGKTATISTTGHNSSVAGISIGNTSNYIEAGVTTTSVVSNTGDVNIEPKSGSSVNVFNSKITNLATPTNLYDAANKYYVDTGLSTKQDTLVAGNNINIAADGKTISAVVPTKTSELQNDGADGTSTYVEADELATVATSGSYTDLINKPTIGNATLTIQKNGTSAGTFTANATSNKTINITVPTTAADVNALPDSTKYAASFSLSIDSSTYVVTGQLKDQDGNNLGAAQTIDLPLESVVISGSYDSATKEVVLVLENGSEIRFSVADLVSGLQSEITSANPLDADLVDDSTSTNKFVTAADITKLNGIQAGAEVNVQSNWTEADSTSDAYILNKPSLATVATSGDYNDLSNKPTIGNATLTIQKNGTNVQTFTANATSNKTANIIVPTKTSDIANDGSDGNSTYVENDDLTVALAGKQDVLTAGTNININSNTISTQTRGIEYIVGTQASATNLWTGVSTDDGCSSGTVYVGKTIAYYLSKAGNGSAATLNLTLPDGTTTGAISVRRNGGDTIGTAYPANAVIVMIYDGTYWKASAYYDSNTTYQLRSVNYVIKAAETVTGNSLSGGTSSGYKNITAGSTFDITYPLMWNTGGNLSAGSTSNSFYYIVEDRSLRVNKPNWTGVANQMVYVFGTLSGNTLTVDSDVFTQTVPTTEDGKVYIPIGITRDTYRISFLSFMECWAYKNGEFRPISHSEPVMTGADSGTAGTAGLVPAPAAGDNTKYLSGDGTWKTVSQYNLPIASASELGGVKIGSRLTINSSTGVLSADSQTDNNFTTTLKDKLDGIAAGAEVNVQANWAEADSTSDAYIKNKPSLATVATSGNYNDLTNKPTIPAAQVNSDWDANSGVAQILNKPSLATVATSGSYNDLSNKPTIPTVNNGTLTIQKNGSSVATFTANQSGNSTANITVPTKTSDITNDSGFITSSGTVAKADQLTTARTIAIGTGATGTATSFNGTSNITIPITDVKDAYVTWGGRGLVNNVSPDDMGCIDEFGHNKLAFLPAECVNAAYSTDGGTTWTNYGLTDAQKIAMVTTAGSTIYVGGSTVPTAETIGDMRLRVRIAAGPTEGPTKIYTAAKKLLINATTGGSSGSKVTIRYRTIANYKAGTETWVTVTPDYDVGGGSGWNSIPFNYTFGGNFSTQTSQIGEFEFTFSCTGLGTYGQKKLGIIDFRLIGMTNWGTPSEMARAGHIYTVDTNQNTFFPNAVLPKTDNAYSLGASGYKWKNLHLSGGIYHGSSLLTLPSTAGTLALTSDIPTVNNATLTIQKNGTNVQTFTANQATNATANITVPTKTSDLTNDSGFVTDATSQNFAAQEGSTNPVFDDMTPVRTIEWDVSDTKYRPIYQMANTNWTYINMDITVAYRITVTGTGIHSVTDIVDRWHNPVSYPITSMFCRTLSNSGATTGFRYLRAVYPVAAYLNNATYPLGQEVAQYNNTARHYKIEVFKDDAQVSWNSVKPSGPIYVSSTYNGNSSMTAYDTRGWRFRQPSQMYAQNAGYADYIANYEPVNVAAGELKNGATALVAGHFAFLAEDGLVYDISNTAKAISVPEAKIGWLYGNINANAAISYTNWRAISRPTAAQTEFFSHDAFALGDRLYLRCTMDSNGKIYSDNYLATNMSAGYTWMPIGWARNATQFYADTRFPMFYTLNSAGKLTHVNGKKTSPDITVTNTDPGEGVALGEGEYVAVYGSSSSLIDMFYPIGSYYETSNTAFDPNVSWGGTWVEDTGGRVLVAQDSGTFTTVGGTGGEETHQLVAAEIPSHHHSIFVNDTAGGGQYASPDGGNYAGQGRNYNTTDTGGGGAHNNLQPYIIIKRWHRTA